MDTMLLDRVASINERTSSMRDCWMQASTVLPLTDKVAPIQLTEVPSSPFGKSKLDPKDRPDQHDKCYLLAAVGWGTTYRKGGVVHIDLEFLGLGPGRGEVCLKDRESTSTYEAENDGPG